MLNTYAAFDVTAAALAAALGEPSHMTLVNIVVVAHAKSDVGPLMEDRGTGARVAAATADVAFRTRRPSADVAALRELGLIPVNQAGVYVLPSRGGQSARVLKLNLDRTASVVAVREGATYRPASQEKP